MCWGLSPGSAAFEAFDTDGSGGIDKNELVAALKQLGMDTNANGAQAIVSKYAGPGVREIALDQFERLVRDLETFQGRSPIRRTSHAKAQIDPKIRAAFEQFDTDRSGDIDVRECKHSERSEFHVPCLPRLPPESHEEREYEERAS